MPLFLDVHSIGDHLPADEIAKIHGGTTEPVSGARCLRHWMSTEGNRMFCLIEADDAVLAVAIHSAITGVEAVECHPVLEHV